MLLEVSAALDSRTETSLFPSCSIENDRYHHRRASGYRAIGEPMIGSWSRLVQTEAAPYRHPSRPLPERISEQILRPQTRSRGRLLFAQTPNSDVAPSLQIELEKKQLQKRGPLQRFRFTEGAQHIKCHVAHYACPNSSHAVANATHRSDVNS